MFLPYLIGSFFATFHAHTVKFAPPLLNHAYTGKPSTFYGSYDYKSIPLEEKLMGIVAGKKSTFVQTQAEPFPELEKVLSWCLETEREERCPNLSYAIKELEKIIV